MLTYATTFSGIGGWELGLDACGWELRWQCECDRFRRTVLAERFGVPIASDIDPRKLFKFLLRTFGSIEAARVDVLVGSPPCQPFSVAGKKHGVDDPRHLYPSFIAAVRVLRPRYVLMENVAGLLSNRRAFGQYIGGLAALGHDIVWHSIPASAVGANHQRDRLWIIAHAEGRGLRCGRAEQPGRLCKTLAGGGSGIQPKPSPAIGGEPAILTNARRKRDGTVQQISVRGSEESSNAGALRENVPDAPVNLRRASGDERPEAFDRRSENVPDALQCAGQSGQSRPIERTVSEGDGGGDGLHYERSGLEERRIQRTAIRADNWAVEPDVGRVADGIPFRMDRLKALGNGVVPQIPKIIGEAINEIERMMADGDA